MELQHDVVKAFVLAGKAIFTVVDEKTSARITYKVVEKDDVRGDGVVHFVSVMSGSSNLSDYTFIGTIFNGKFFRHSWRSGIPKDHSSVRFTDQFFSRLLAGSRLGAVKVYHEGLCGRCGLPLTVPESILLGLGPKCRRM